MEELLAQLLQQRALQTKAESDARTQAALATFPVGGLMQATGENRLFRGRDNGGVSEAEGYEQYDRSLGERPAAAPRLPGQPFRPTPAPGMPGHGFDPDDAHTGTYTDDWSGQERDKFPRVPVGTVPLSAGQGSRNLMGAYGAVMPGDDAGDGGPPLISPVDERNLRRLYGPANTTGAIEPTDLISDAALARSYDVEQTGWLPADFDGMSHAAAAALIADQLRTQRIKTLGLLDPEYQAQQPKY